MMRKALAVARREYLERVKRQGFLIGTIIGPIAMTAVIVFPVLLMSETVTTQMHLKVVDETGRIFGTLANELADTLRSGQPRFILDQAVLPPIPEDSLAIDLGARMSMGQADAFLLVPKGIFHDEPARLYSEKRAADVVAIESVEQALSTAVVACRLEDDGLDTEHILGLTRGVGLEVLRTTRGKVRTGGFMIEFLITFVLVILIYMTTFIHGNSIMRSVLEEKTGRIVEVLLAGLSPFQILLGKVVGVGAVGLTQYAIWGIFAAAASSYVSGLGGAWASYGAIPGHVLVFFILFFVLGYFFYASIYAAIGAMVNSEHDAQQLQWPITSLLIVALILVQSVVSNPAALLPRIASLIPPFTPFIMFARISIYPVPAGEVIASILLCLASIVLLIFLAARIFRVGILMYGRRPTLPELLRWVRAG